MPNGARNWCFTLNNYDENDILSLQEFYNSQSDNGPASIRYLVFQQEVGEEGTPHLQGYISFKGQKSLSWLKKMVSDRAHFGMAKGTTEQNRAYCTKDDTRKEGSTPIEMGVPPAGVGKRTDLSALRDFIANDPLVSRKRLLEEFPDQVGKYPRFVRECREVYTPVPEVEDHPLRVWQRGLTNALALPPNDREIIFLVDQVGNRGKTWFAKRYCQQNENAQYMEPSKKADMAHALETNKRVLFVNVTRQQVEHLQYSFLESVKDGMVFSPKYESGMKFLPKMHVVVMMNEKPDLNLLSNDRYNIINLE